MPALVDRYGKVVRKLKYPPDPGEMAKAKQEASQMGGRIVKQKGYKEGGSLSSIGGMVDELESWPDETLLEEYQTQTLGVPQYLIIAELGRRKDAREPRSEGQLPQQTVADEVVASMGGGLGGIPQMAQPQMPPPQMPPQGGVRGFQEGGVTREERIAAAESGLVSPEVGTSLDWWRERLGQLGKVSDVRSLDDYTKWTEETFPEDRSEYQEMTIPPEALGLMGLGALGLRRPIVESTKYLAKGGWDLAKGAAGLGKRAWTGSRDKAREGLGAVAERLGRTPYIKNIPGMPKIPRPITPPVPVPRGWDPLVSLREARQKIGEKLLWPAVGTGAMGAGGIWGLLGDEEEVEDAEITKHVETEDEKKSRERREVEVAEQLAAERQLFKDELALAQDDDEASYESLIKSAMDVNYGTEEYIELLKELEGNKRSARGMGLVQFGAALASDPGDFMGALARAASKGAESYNRIKGENIDDRVKYLQLSVGAQQLEAKRLIDLATIAASVSAADAKNRYTTNLRDTTYWRQQKDKIRGEIEDRRDELTITGPGSVPPEKAHLHPELQAFYTKNEETGEWFWDKDKVTAIVHERANRDVSEQMGLSMDSL